MEKIFEERFKLSTSTIFAILIGIFFMICTEIFIGGFILLLLIIHTIFSGMYKSGSKKSVLILGKHSIKSINKDDVFEIPFNKIIYSNFIDLNSEKTWIIGTQNRVYSIHLEEFRTDEIEIFAYNSLSPKIFNDESIKSCGNYISLLQE